MNVVEVRGLHKNYGQVKVLEGLDMTVKQGEVYGFLGRNGAGKSTTLRILAGILQIGAGEVKLFGEPMENRNTSLRARIGYVAQEQRFYGWMTPTVLGKFVRGFYPNWDDALYKSLLETLELPPDRKVGTFSGGMKAKQGLALALAHNPPLLVLDEPTAGLDPVARREFLQIVADQSQVRGSTVLFSSHLIDEVERSASRVGIIEGRRMLYEGGLQDLAAQVRYLRLGEGLPEPEIGDHLELLRRTPEGLILRCQSAEGFPVIEAPHVLEPMNLEDIFVELVTHRGRSPDAGV